MSPNTIPDTASYLYLGLTVIGSIVALFVGQTLYRHRTLTRQLKQVEELARDIRR